MAKQNLVEEVVENKTPHRGIYLLPNLFTTAGLFAGFYAIVTAMRGVYDDAAIAIFIAMIADLLDGRVARMTNTQSAFGAEYDSLSDMVAFGIAPALVIFSWSLLDLGNFGWLAAFCYAAAGALRLARFNTLLGVQDKRFFRGLPIPAAAAVIAGLVWVGQKNGIAGNSISILAAIITVIIALLMVSNFHYYSFKDIKFHGKVPFVALLLIVLIYICVSMNPPIVLLSVFGIYATTGPLFAIWRKCRTRKHEAKTHSSST